MKIIWDESAPKEVLFFHPMIREAESRGHENIIVSRTHSGVVELQQSFKLHPQVVGAYGGNTLKGKLSASTLRIAQLTPIVEEADAVICLSNPDSARAAFGLGKPLFCFNDIPEAEAQSRLTIPQSTWLLAPKMIPKWMFERYGHPKRGIWQYDAIDPIVWLKTHKVNTHIREELGLDPEKPIIVFRESEMQAAYLHEKSEIVLPLMMGLANVYPDAQLVCKPRYDAEAVKDNVPNVHVLEGAVDLQSLLYYADLFVGGGGTMNIEAAYFGVPTISCRAILTVYDSWLVEKGLSVRANTVGEACHWARKLMGTRNEKLADEVFGKMEFPTREVVDLIEGG